MDLKLAGASVLITGGSRGIGFALAQGFAAEGAHVAICGRDRGRLDQAVAALNAAGAQAVGIQADLFKAEDCIAAVEGTVAAFGRLDVLVNNASTNVDKTPKSLEDATDEQVLERFMGKTLGAIRCTRAALAHLRAVRALGGAGRIVCIGGMAARAVQRGAERPGAGSGLPQGLGNSALANFVKYIAEEGAPDGIVANIVHPSLTRTERHVGRMERKAATQGISIAAAEAETASHFPIGRVPGPEDIVPLVLLLSSPLAGAITGQAIAVDGGASRAIMY
jgi:3-oxoacyl-[acyl-carrier protein] reductase